MYFPATPIIPGDQTNVASFKMSQRNAATTNSGRSRQNNNPCIIDMLRCGSDRPVGLETEPLVRRDVGEYKHSLIFNLENIYQDYYLPYPLHRRWDIRLQRYSSAGSDPSQRKYTNTQHRIAATSFVKRKTG